VLASEAKRRWRPHDPLAGSPVELVRRGASTVGAAVDAALAQRATPAALFERWERHRWSAGELDLDADRVAWREGTSPGMRRQLRLLVEKLAIGEYTAVDHVSLAMAGAPDEGHLVYLATQSADEAQHWRFVTRLAAEVQGHEAEPRTLLADAWRGTTPALRELVLFEAEVARALAARPTDYELWLRLVAVFHLLTEGVIATTGQRSVMRMLAQRGAFPGMLAGFAALARDEGRHVGFGLHALREGVEAGCGDAIWDAVERIAPAVVAVDVDPGAHRVERVLGERSGRRMIETLERRLRAVGATEPFVAHVRARCDEALSAAGARTETAR
jgi:hypothetical protein